VQRVVGHCFLPSGGLLSPFLPCRTYLTRHYRQLLDLSAPFVTLSFLSGQVAQTGQGEALNGNEYLVRFSPDGLTEQLIDVLLREVDVAGVGKPRPVSASMTGQAAQRRCRREARRSVAAVVRALPVHGTAGGPNGRAA
jgi:hypothetical protein